MKQTVKDERQNGDPLCRFFALPGDQFYSVAEVVFYVATIQARDIGFRPYWNASGLQFENKAAVMGANQSRVGFLSGAKIFFHPEMNLDIATSEPCAAVRGQSRRLGYFLHPEKVDVETAGIGFKSLGHRELDMGKAGERHD